MEKSSWKQRITIYSFIICLIGFMAAFALLPKQALSEAERRRLAVKPELTLENIANESYMEDLESYLLDHFPLRDGLRKLKAYFAYGVLKQKENNDIFIAQNSATKLEYPLNESSIVNTADKLKNLKAQYFSNSQVYYSIIPDKNYFTAAQNGYPSIDYDKMTQLLRENLPESEYQYIDIIDTLTINDYYKTDTHWQQDKILNTAYKIADAMGAGVYIQTDLSSYEQQEIADFYGVYYGQSALPLEADTIHYLTNDTIHAAQSWNLETNLTKPVYELNKLDDEKSVDKYDIFLGGAAALQIIKSPDAATDRRLIIFRDSYTSSLAPLFLEAYSEITLIDLRYISSTLIGDYVDFKNADILFLYNTLIINNSSMLK